MSIVQTHLSDRALLRLGGADREDFLQNLLTQNIAALPAQSCAMSALLTPQGKVLFDFLVFAQADCYLIDCAAEQAAALTKKLALYKLRADVRLSDSPLKVYALWQEDGLPCPPMAGFIDDPRHAGLGLRGIFDSPPNIALPQASLAQWHGNRIHLGVPQGPDDMPTGTAFPLEFGFQHMHAIDFQKGCFIGQEVTSRTHRKGSLRKKLHCVRFDGPPAAAQADIMAGERIVGHIVAVHGDSGLAIIREDALDLELLTDSTKVLPSGGLFNETA
jgi:folate-binding protein YgfZ